MEESAVATSTTQYFLFTNNIQTLISNILVLKAYNLYN